MWLEVLCWIDHVWSSKECVGYACDPSVRLDVPSMCFVCIFVGGYNNISSVKSLRAASQVFALLMVLCVICILCGRVRACSCYASLVCCACLPSVLCL